jgi:hypothetical protein
MSDIKLYYEEVTEEVCGVVLASNVRLATEDEIKAAKKLHEEGDCPCVIVVDEKGWLYDFRRCAICGQGLGLV